MRAPTRIAIAIGGGYVPGLNAVINGTVLAASELGWAVIGIRDGFDGLLFPDRYQDGGTVSLAPNKVESSSSSAGAILGTGVRSDPFHVRTIDADNRVQEVDRSDALMRALEAKQVDAVISVVDSRALSILWKLHRKGLKTVCVPESVENDVAVTLLSFGFNSALSFTTEMLDRMQQAARATRKIGVVEVLGEHAGWLALQAGISVCADAVLIPEIPYHLAKVAAKICAKLSAERPYGLVVVAEGATPAVNGVPSSVAPSAHPLRASLSPLATGPQGTHVIGRCGHAAETVALVLQRLTNHETYALALGQVVKGGPPTAVDRQLGLGYGAGAVRALAENRSGVMVAFQPPDLTFVPLGDALNKVRTVSATSVFVQTARSLGIALGD